MTLEVGSIIYGEGFRDEIVKHVITRVTAKRAYARVETSGSGYELVFDRETKGEDVRDFGCHDSWHRITYSIETPQLKAKYHLAFMRRKFDTIKSSQLSVEQLEQILPIAFPKKATL